MVDACLFSAVSTLSEFDEVANGKQTWRRFYCTSRKRSLVVVDVVYVLLLTSLHHARTFHFTSDTQIYINIEPTLNLHCFNQTSQLGSTPTPIAIWAHYRKTLFFHRYFYIHRYRRILYSLVRLTDDFNIHSSVSPAQPMNISCTGLTWPCHVYSSVNR
jgi:hypothetical protein